MSIWNFKQIFLIIAFFLVGETLPCCSQGVLKITFDGPPQQPRGTAYGVTNYYESGMAFTPIDTNTPGGRFTRNGGGTSGSPDDGTAYLQPDDLAFCFTNGLFFNLVSVDLAAYSEVVPDLDVSFIGYKSDGSIVTNSFSGNGIDFQTYHFGSEFTSLTRVEVPIGGWSLDNLIIQPCPPALSFRLISWSPPGTFVPVLSFPTISNQTYALEFSSDLTPGRWSNVPGIAENFDSASKIKGDGGDVLLVDTNAILSINRFYRIRVLP